MDCVKKIKNKMKYIKKITKDLRYELGYYRVEDMGCPHKQPNDLPLGYSAIYIFIYKSEFLKIGKANSNSNARFKSQHYGFSANSTLAKSLCEEEDFISLGINKDNVKSWMLKNLWRINIYVRADEEKTELAKTELIEAILHYAFRPRFEGNIH